MPDPVSLKAIQQALSYQFKTKPLLIGGAAMEYYGLRKRGEDIDLIISAEDYTELAKIHPDYKRDIFGDLGICKDGYEVWRTIMLFDYNHISKDAGMYNDLLVASLEKLLLLKAVTMSEEKYLKDLKLIVKKIIGIQYEQTD